MFPVLVSQGMPWFPSVTKMGSHPSHVKGARMQTSWKADIQEFVDVTERWTQDAVASMDEAIEQKDVGRWRAGNYKRKPSAPKMTAIRRLLRVLDLGPGDYERGLLYAADQLEAKATQLRVMAGATASLGDATETAARGRRATGAG